jgi:probable rRNA maturation factor
MKNMSKKNSIKLDLQIHSKLKSIPAKREFKRWLAAALSGAKANYELTIRVVSFKEITNLNQRYRGKSGPTNILSFPFTAPPGIKSNLLGDIVISAPIVHREAKQQSKPEKNHWAHLTVHGVLHLLGYDHIKAKDAQTMEKLEIKILRRLGIANPYESFLDQSPLARG